MNIIRPSTWNPMLNLNPLWKATEDAALASLRRTSEVAARESTHEAVKEIAQEESFLGRPVTPEQRTQNATSNPVILVGGYAAPSQARDGVGMWDAFARSLRRDGFREVHVFDAPDNGMGDGKEAVAELARFREQVMRSTGADQVQMVGHSRGGMFVLHDALNPGGTPNTGVVERAVIVNSPSQGIDLGPALAPGGAVDSLEVLPEGAKETFRGSPEMETLADALRNRGRDAGTEFVSVYTRQSDGLVNPPDAARLPDSPNMRNIELDDPASYEAPLGVAAEVHLRGIMTNDRAYEAVRDALSGSAGTDTGSR